MLNKIFQSLEKPLLYQKTEVSFGMTNTFLNKCSKPTLTPNLREQAENFPL